MKKIFFTTVCILYVIQVHAIVFTTNGITYSTDSKGATITGVSSTLTGDVVIPGAAAQSIPGTAYPVVGIADRAFQNGTNITSVTIPLTVSSIWYSAFSGCTNLSQINVSADNSNYASLDGVLFEKNLTALICHPNKHGSSYTIPSTVTSVYSNAFYGNADLTSVTIPNSVNQITRGAFNNCTNLTGFTLRADNPNYVLNDGVLYNKGLSTLVKYPAKKAGNSLTIPSTVSTIDDTFNDCAALTDITVSWTSPASVTIPTNAFSSIQSACTLHVPAGTKATYQATDIWKDFKNIVETSQAPVLFSIDGNDVLVGYFGSNSVITIPDGVKAIGENVFSKHTYITSVTFPNSVTDIRTGAFTNCSKLTSINIPKGVTNIGKEAFKGCTGLTAITIPGSVTNIGESAFYNCSGLTTVIIQEGATNMEANVFKGCTELTSITIPGSMVEIRDDAFTNFTKLNTVTFSEGITNIGKNAFKGCAGLTTVNMPGSVKTIGNSAFYGCKELTTLNIPMGLTHIDDYAFSGCIKLNTSVNLPNATYIGDYAFDGCTKITSLTLSAGLTYINTSFMDCHSLTSLIIPSGITEIKEKAFAYCRGLTSIIIPQSVTAIGGWAFSGHSVLSDVYVFWETPLAIADNFMESKTPCNLHVPPGKKEVYQNAPIWKEFNIIDDAAVYTVTFDTQGGSAVASDQVLKGGKVNRPADPTRTNYIFGGWYKEAACNNAWNFTTEVVNGNTTLYAKWTPFAVPVITITTQPTAITNVTVGNISGNLTVSATVTQGATLSYQWYSNAASDNTGGTAISGATAAKLSIPTTLTTGTYYYFCEVRATGGATSVRSNAATVNVTTASVTTYTVTFNPQGGSAVASATVSSGDKITRPADPTRTGYTFGGWYKEAACTNAWDFGTGTANDNLTLYAKWTATGATTYTVTFDTQGGSTVAPATVNAGSTATRPADPTRTDYIFGGWFKEAACTNGWNFNTDVVNSNTSLYAKWTEKSANTYTVTFNSQGGSEVTPAIANAGSTVTRPVDPTRAGYKFVDWYKEADCINIWNFDTDMVTDNITLYAKWMESTTGLEIADKPLVKLYPNPTDGLFTLNFETPGKYRITITTVSGKVLQRQTISDQEKQMDISSYPAGIYLLVIDDGKQQSVTKIVKK